MVKVILLKKDTMNKSAKPELKLLLLFVAVITAMILVKIFIVN